MSGGWTTSFELAEAATVTLTFRFQLDQAANYEADENSDARVRLDNQEIVLAQLVGNGNGGGLETTGQPDVSLDFSLLAGSHTLILGGFNNKKTSTDESTQVFYNNELDAAVVDHLEFYLLNYFKPGLYEANAFTDFDRQLMDDLGCVTCHVAELQIDSDRRVADVETAFDPVQGIFNQRFATTSTLFDVFDDGEEFPQLLPQEQPFLVSNFFSDLKHHDLGPAFHERDFDGNTVTLFVTEPLWGVGSTSPYGHDGRSINLDAVIRRHGGEALGSQQAYVALPVEDQMALHAFLQTLVLFPPDDTASNLNPGAPRNPGGIQTPAVHGSINLGALFQIPDEGPE